MTDVIDDILACIVCGLTACPGQDGSYIVMCRWKLYCLDASPPKIPQFVMEVTHLTLQVAPNTKHPSKPVETSHKLAA